VSKPELTEEETALIEKFRQLTERHKGRIEQLIMELLAQQDQT
jgi:hypothetical protein